MPAENETHASIDRRSPLRWAARNFHFAATVILTVMLLWALRAAHFPVRFNWPQYFISNWVVFGLRSIFGAALFFVLGCPEQFKRWLSSPHNPAPLGSQLASAASRAGAVFLPAAYLFIGLIAAFSYNDVIAALKFDFKADWLLNRADAWIMGGLTVSRLSHLTAAHVGLRPFDVMTFIYFLLFLALGSCLVFLDLQSGKARAMQFVGALMTPYWIVVGVFYLLPAVGPFVICADHFTVFPRAMKMYGGQSEYIEVLKGYIAGRRADIVAAHYFAALPCMHIVQPLIALWFLRPWKRLAAAFVAFNILLISCIILLEQHYVVDLLAGVLLARLAIVMVDESAFRGGRIGTDPAPSVRDGLLPHH